LHAISSDFPTHPPPTSCANLYVFVGFRSAALNMQFMGAQILFELQKIKPKIAERNQICFYQFLDDYQEK